MNDYTEPLLRELELLSNRARHPALELSRFTDLGVNAEEAPLEPAQELLARRRRGAVIYAANQIIDDCLDDQRDVVFDPERAVCRSTRTRPARPWCGAGSRLVIAARTTPNSFAKWW